MVRGVAVSTRLALAGALGSGILFGVGLVVSGMTNPAKVLGFLNWFGDWDPSLMFVMLGAIGVHAPLLRAIIRRKSPLAAHGFAIPAVRRVDARLVVGSALFGVGWGLSGYCPGPAVVALASGSGSVLVFVVAVLCGSFVASRLDARGAQGGDENQVKERAAAAGAKSLSALRP
jgi:uncharacterized membrane protein YedE/YeeE